MEKNKVIAFYKLKGFNFEMENRVVENSEYASHQYIIKEKNKWMFLGSEKKLDWLKRQRDNSFNNIDTDLFESYSFFKWGTWSEVIDFLIEDYGEEKAEQMLTDFYTWLSIYYHYEYEYISLLNEGKGANYKICDSWNKILKKPEKGERVKDVLIKCGYIDEKGEWMFTPTKGDVINARKNIVMNLGIALKASRLTKHDLKDSAYMNFLLKEFNLPLPAEANFRKLDQPTYKYYDNILTVVQQILLPD